MIQPQTDFRASSVAPPRLIVQPLTAGRWPDLEALFGLRGACGGCWCMYWRLGRSQFERQKGEPNKYAMRQLVEAGDSPGLLGYIEGRPVAWCSVGPREAFPRLDSSRILSPVDDRRVWSIPCLFVAKPFRRRGVTVELLEAAIRHVAARGGKMVEGYPIEPDNEHMPDVFAWTGLASAFLKAGFRECARRSDKRPIMRYEIE
jgi:GNAT superfamily N-acetyltransferase